MRHLKIYSPPNKRSGFTIIELVTVIVIVGILGAVVAPRFFGREVYDDRGFVDTTLSALHYAQKSAIAQRRTVCVTFAPSSLTLTIASVFGGACNTPLTGPTGDSPYVVTARGASAYGASANFSFTPLGSASQGQVITVAGYPGKTITVDATTGYAY